MPRPEGGTPISLNPTEEKVPFQFSYGEQFGEEGTGVKMVTKIIIVTDDDAPKDVVAESTKRLHNIMRATLGPDLYAQTIERWEAVAADLEKG